MQVLNSLKSLGVTLDELYSGNKEIVFKLKINNIHYPFNVVLKDRKGEVDCCITSWTANIYTRTKKGMSMDKYKTISTLQCAIVKRIIQSINIDEDCTIFFNTI